MSLKERKATHNQLIIAIDFDKTICDTEYPNIGPFFSNSIEIINKWYDLGAYIIIWTCRTGQSLYEAEAHLLKNRVKFHKINDQHPNGLLNFGTEIQLEHNLHSRKVWSHILIDDTSIDWMLNGHPGWVKLDLMIKKIIEKNKGHWDIKI